MAEDGEVRLVADIGGTNARFALTGDGLTEPTHIRVLACADYPTLEDAIVAYLSELAERPRRAAVAVATAVTGDEIRMTNHVWSFSIDAVRKRLDLDELLVLNDFTALALAVPQLRPEQRQQIGGGSPVPGTPMAVIGPGTGLGVSGLIPTGDRYIPLQSEGGHVTYGAANKRQSAILAMLARRFNHISAERLISGPGLVNLYQAIAEVEGKTPEPLAPAQISARAIARSCPLCIEALETFCAMLGTAAGNLVLTLGARNGVFIGGGIVPRLGSYFETSPFRSSFEHRGRFSAYLAAVPSYVIRAEYPALIGAADAFTHPPHEVGRISRR
jgi:glucokinase